MSCCVDCRDRVLEVGDGGDRGLQDEVLDSGLVVAPDAAVGVDHDLDVQAVMDEEQALGESACPANTAGSCRPTERSRSLRRIVRPGRVGGHVRVAAGRERRDLVQQLPAARDHLRAAHRVVGRAALGAAVLGDGVRPVQRVVERPPARVRSVQRVARIEHRDDQLRPGDRRDLGIDVGGRDLDRRPARVRDSRGRRGIRGSARASSSGWSRCQPSIAVCSRSRSASSARLIGVSSSTMRSKPAQNASGPIDGCASDATKSASSRATCRDPIVR